MTGNPLQATANARGYDLTATLPIKLRRRVAVRLLPYLFLLYIVAFLDRVNVSYAALDMTRELGFDPSVLGFGFGIFFVGYFLLEIPSTVIVERWSARKWMARIMVSWGVIAACLGFIHSAHAFYWLRFLLGAAEAGFFPGLIVYLSHWFTDRDRGKAVALFMAALPVSFIIGSPISGKILGIHWWGLSGWRWIFILEGIPAVAFGLANLFVLTDWPREARWLNADERVTLQAAIDEERKNKPFHMPALSYLSHRPVILLTLIYFFAVCGSYGFGLWLPTMLKRLSGLPNMQVTLLAALPYAVSLVCMLIFGWTSDRTGERRWHTAVPLFVTAAGFSIGSIWQVSSLWAVMTGYCLVGAGVYTLMPSFWALPGRYLAGTAAAVSVGIINSFGNLGGLFGPWMMGLVQRHTHSFAIGMGALMCTQIAGGLLVFVLRPADGT